jgi:hypothetical protein
MSSENERLVDARVRRRLAPRRWRTSRLRRLALVRRLNVRRPDCVSRRGRATTRPRARKALPAVTADGAAVRVASRGCASFTARVADASTA